VAAKRNRKKKPVVVDADPGPGPDCGETLGASQDGVRASAAPEDIARRTLTLV
jgi:hypothetical protein